MKQGDTVGDFRDRLNILLMGAENALKEDKGRAYEGAMMLPMKEAAIDIFIRGLPGNISASVDALHPADLESAYKEAVRIEARIRLRILPESRQSAQLGQYAEQGELSQNIRPRRRFYPAFTPAGGVRNQPAEFGLGSGPAFVRYLETEVPGDNNFEGTALAYPETDASFIGYVTPGITYQTHGPQTPSQPQDSRNATHQGYPPRRRRGGRGGYYGQGRPNTYTDTRLYDPHASSHQIIDQGRATSSYSPLNNNKLAGGSPTSTNGEPRDYENHTQLVDGTRIAIQSADPGPSSTPNPSQGGYRIASCGAARVEDTEINDPTVVRIRVAEGRQPWLTFMVDNGATVNLIKIGSLYPSTMVDTNQATPLIGINDQTVDTLGSVTVNIRNRPVPFLVTMNDFPIEQDGVLGRDYLKKEQAVIYHYNALIIGGDVMHPLLFINPRTGNPVEVHLMEAVESCGQDNLDDVEVDQPKTLVNREAAILEGCTPSLATELE